MQDWKSYNRSFVAVAETQEALMVFCFAMLGVITVFIVLVVFYMIVSHKSKDIGILKSIGISNTNVLLLFIFFAFLVGLVGSAIGTVAGWQFYGGSWDRPDLSAPIIPSVTEIVMPTNGLRHIWAVNDPVPADTPDGPHTLVITLTATTGPSLTTWDSALLWCGDWVAPPGGKSRIYLPLVVRSP